MRRARLRRGAFTLVEIVLALAIFALLAGGIFAAVSAATRSTALLTFDLSTMRTVDAFIDFCRMGFANAGAAQNITVGTRPSRGSGRIIEITVHDAPDAFNTGLAESAGSCVVLSALPDGAGAATLSMARYPVELDPAEVNRYLENKAIWTALMEGVIKLRWRFLNPSSGKFEEDWTAAPTEIAAVLLEMTIAGGDEIEAIFRIPKVTRSAQAELNESDSSALNGQ